MLIRGHIVFEAKKVFPLLLGLIVFVVSSSWAAEGTRTTEARRKAQLFIHGARLWPNYCGNCHNPRGPSDRSPVDWDLVITHRRSTSNIPAADAEAGYSSRVTVERHHWADAFTTITPFLPT